MTTQKKIVLTMTERVHIIDLLREILVPVGDIGFKYPPNWTDGRVAEKAGGRANQMHVAYLRLQMFGRLVTEPVAPLHNNDSDLQARLTSLEERFERLSAALGGI